MKRSVLTRYRVMAYVTGVFLILLTLACVAQYLMHVKHAEVAVAILGTAHGWLYIVYLVFAFDLGMGKVYSLAASPVGDTMAALAQANRDRFISVDPNVRPTVVPDMEVWRARLAVLLPLADLVKISAEDLELLWPGRRAEALAADVAGWIATCAG